MRFEPAPHWSTIFILRHSVGFCAVDEQPSFLLSYQMADAFLIIGLFFTALVFGGLIFFSIIVAPTTFSALEAPYNGQFLRAIFPRFYVYQALLAALGGLSLSFSSATQIAALLLFLVSVLAVKARFILLPRINGYRDRMLAGDNSAETPFNILHKASVFLNLVQIILCGFTLCSLAQV